jgi:hypothetical protein
MHGFAHGIVALFFGEWFATRVTCSAIVAAVSDSFMVAALRAFPPPKVLRLRVLPTLAGRATPSGETPVDRQLARLRRLVSLRLSQSNGASWHRSSEFENGNVQIDFGDVTLLKSGDY